MRVGRRAGAFAVEGDGYRLVIWLALTILSLIKRGAVLLELT